jgi:hypothetical protein
MLAVHDYSLVAILPILAGTGTTPLGQDRTTYVRLNVKGTMPNSPAHAKKTALGMW